MPTRQELGVADQGRASPGCGQGVRAHEHGAGRSGRSTQQRRPAAVVEASLTPHRVRQAELALPGSSTRVRSQGKWRRLQGLPFVVPPAMMADGVDDGFFRAFFLAGTVLLFLVFLLFPRLFAEVTRPVEMHVRNGGGHQQQPDAEALPDCCRPSFHRVPACFPHSDDTLAPYYRLGSLRPSTHNPSAPRSGGAEYRRWLATGQYTDDGQQVLSHARRSSRAAPLPERGNHGHSSLPPRCRTSPTIRMTATTLTTAPVRLQRNCQLFSS